MPENPTTRRRTVSQKLGARTETSEKLSYPASNPTGIIVQVTPPSSRVASGIQVTVSEGHPWPPRKGTKGDVGGDFSTSRQYVEGAYQHLSLNDKNWHPVYLYYDTAYKYEGPFIAGDHLAGSNNYAFPTSSPSTNVQLDVLGAKAIEICKPTNSVADASTFLGELMKDGLPSLIGSSTWKARTLRQKQLGDEYLNVQFGWQPLLRDLTKFGEAVRHANTVMKQYERDAGGVVRRQYEFPLFEKQEIITKPDSGFYGPTQNRWYSNVSIGTQTVSRITTRRQWFSGAFTYHLPSGYDSRDRMDRYALMADKLFGLSLTPETLWNLAPWSWAADWFSSTGAVISNLTSWSTDGLVMRYGYIMEHTIVKDIYTRTGPVLKNGLNPQPLTLVTETKVRRQANPFGFGISWSGLSPFQLSVAAALGLTKGSR